MPPHRRQPTRLPHPWDSPGKNTGVGCHFLLQCMKLKSESEVVQSCPTLRDPLDCSLLGSSVRGIFKASVLEWVATASLWAHWIHSFPIHLSCLWPSLFPRSPCFLHSSSSSAITVGHGNIPWMEVWGALIYIWRPEIADGCDISCLSILQEMFSFHSPICLSLPFGLHLHRTNDCSFSVSSFYPSHLILPQMAPSHFYISQAGAPVLSHLH